VKASAAMTRNTSSTKSAMATSLNKVAFDRSGQS